MEDFVLVVHSSPRRSGNSSYLAGKAIEGIKARGGKVEELFLAEMKIAPCQACETCRDGKHLYCKINDDMKGVYAKVAAAKSILLASPIYWFSFNAQLKLFLDRLYGLNLEAKNVLKNKKIGVILTYGDVDPLSSGAVNAIRNLEQIFQYCGSKIVDTVYGTGNDPGDIAANAELAERATKLGRGLA